VVAAKTRRPSFAILRTVISDTSNVAGLFEGCFGPQRIDLADREVDGISVVLYWTPKTNVVTVSVADLSTGDYFELVLDDEPPLDVFYHPFAYARARGIDLGDVAPQPEEVAIDALDP
jgi:hypothetical protein